MVTNRGIALLAAVEIVAALLFAFRRTLFVGLTILLSVFVTAIVADFAHGGFPFRFTFMRLQRCPCSPVRPGGKETA